jgi:hypothetical protein
MTGLPQDDVVLRARVPGIPFDEAGATGQVRVTAGTRNVVITIDPGLDLVVHVENPRDLGSRLPGASLLVRRGAQTIQLYSDGEPTTGYRFRGLASGDVGTFWILSEGGTHSVHAPGLKPGADVRVRPIAGRSITVRLKGSAGASSVRVSADHEGLGVGGQVRSDGSYEIRGLPEGTSWTITGEALSSDGSTRLTGRATAVAGGTVELELKPWQPLRAR